MEFNDVMKKKIFPILHKYGFNIGKDSEESILFQSYNVKVHIICNDYEHSFLIEIGKVGEMLYPLNNEIIRLVFNLEFPIEKISLSSFVENTILLFESKIGIEILKGNIKLLKDSIEKQARNYTLKIIQEQALDSALKAWELKDYVSFIKNIDIIGLDKVSKSYQLKYEIAKQKVEL